MIAGIDFSTKAVDVVLLDEDTDAANWHRFELEGQDAFDRSRGVRGALPPRSSLFWAEAVAIGIEEPQAYGPRRARIGDLFRIQGAVIACLPQQTLVQPLWPTQWRKTVGLPGNASKEDVRHFANAVRLKAGSWVEDGKPYYHSNHEDWPSDPCDAYCIALATRTLLQHGRAAA